MTASTSLAGPTLKASSVVGVKLGGGVSGVTVETDADGGEVVGVCKQRGETSNVIVSTFEGSTFFVSGL
jgi:hypothetical protein